MRRLKVVFGGDAVFDESSGQAIVGRTAKLVDADTGEELGCVRDFSINVPLEGPVTVEAEMLVAGIEVKSAPATEE